MRTLWERGAAHKAKVAAELPTGTVRLSDLDAAAPEEATCEAIDGGADTIYGGQTSADDLLGEPDLLLRRGTGYVAADIKSGRADVRP